MPAARHPARYWLLLLGIGAVGGLLSGMFAIGGGVVLVPLLKAMVRMDHRRAVATSLLAIVPTAVVASIAYIANGEFDPVAAALISVGAIAGALVGSALLRRIPVLWLEWMFIALLVVIAVRLALVAPVRGDTVVFSPAVAVAYVTLGLFIGVASGLFGIGGGVLAVPALVVLFSMSDLVAKGTSLLVVLPTSVVGAVANTRAGLTDVRAGLAVGAAAAATSVLGVRIALAMSPRLSGVLFAALLLLVAAQLSWRAIVARRRADAGPPD